MAYKTPGVYVEEISLFPPSVAEVETAIPAFIGYTEKATDKGEDLTNKPRRISSLLEYRALFGGAYEIAQVNVKVNPDNNYSVEEATPAKRFYMFDSLRLFFDNGGGDCYIVSVGNYGDTVRNGDPSDPNSKGLRVGLKKLEKYDEPTIILFPDAALLTDPAHFYTLQQSALAQCGKLQDRVCVFDLFEGPGDWEAGVNGFRDKIGINNLKYGAAYTPWLHTTYAREIDFAIFRDSVTDNSAAANKVDLEKITSDDALNDLVINAAQAITDRDDVIAKTVEDLRGASPSLKDEYGRLKEEIANADAAGLNPAFTDLMDFVRNVAAGDSNASPPVAGVADWATSLRAGTNLKREVDSYAGSILAGALNDLVALEKAVVALPNPPGVDSGLADAAAVDTRYGALNATKWLSGTVSSIGSNGKDYSEGGSLGLAETLQAIVADVDVLFYKDADESVLGFIQSARDAASTNAAIARETLYRGHSIVGNIVEHIKRELSEIPPSGAIAGIYAFVDRTRGVWKAPANVSLSAVRGPVVPIDHFEQESLNIDVTAGKSINAIRTFTGRGTIVWGARTLAGNDNEWRYVPVRRFFNMVEESVKKSTAWAVFEPNAAPLWVKVKGMIDNYLIQKWREGALAGAVPGDAFFVKVGLGTTMTAQDILEGRMIVEIGMAVVRPAEFIILKFSHKMQQS